MRPPCCHHLRVRPQARFRRGCACVGTSRPVGRAGQSGGSDSECRRRAKDAPVSPGRSFRPRRARGRSTAPALPSIFAALEEQLGLELVSERTLVPTPAHRQNQPACARL